MTLPHNQLTETVAFLVFARACEFTQFSVTKHKWGWQLPTQQPLNSAVRHHQDMLVMLSLFGLLPVRETKLPAPGEQEPKIKEQMLPIILSGKLIYPQYQPSTKQGRTILEATPINIFIFLLSILYFIHSSK